MARDQTIDINEEVTLRPRGIFRRKERPEIPCQESTTSEIVGLIEHCGNRRRQLERLASAWNQDFDKGAKPDGAQDDPLIGASAEPRRRPRTRLTDEEVDAMRTARANGVSVTALAKQYEMHRGTVWAKTRES